MGDLRISPSGFKNFDAWSEELLDQEESIKLGYRLLHKKYPSMRILDFFSKLSGNYKKRQLIEFKFKNTN
jgi:hypothetical protein